MGSRPLVYVLRDGRERDGAWASPRCVCAGAFSLGRGSLRVSLVPIPNFPRSRVGTVEGWSECQSGLRPPWRRRAGTGMFTVWRGQTGKAVLRLGPVPPVVLSCLSSRPWPPLELDRHCSAAARPRGTTPTSLRAAF